MKSTFSNGPLIPRATGETPYSRCGTRFSLRCSRLVRRSNINVSILHYTTVSMISRNGTRSGHTSHPLQDSPTPPSDTEHIFGIVLLTSSLPTHRKLLQHTNPRTRHLPRSQPRRPRRHLQLDAIHRGQTAAPLRLPHGPLAPVLTARRRARHRGSVGQTAHRRCSGASARNA